MVRKHDGSQAHENKITYTTELHRNNSFIVFSFIKEMYYLFFFFYVQPQQLELCTGTCTDKQIHIS